MGILGDFNLPHASWYRDRFSSAARPTPLATHAERESIEAATGICALHNFYQLNIIVNIHNSVLDLVLFQDEACSVLQADDCMLPLDGYHPPLEVTVPTFTDRNNYSGLGDGYYRDFKSVNFNLINDFLGGVDWDALLAGVGLNGMVNIFYDTIYSALDMYVPLKRVSTGCFPRWYSPELKHCIIEKKRAHKKYKATGLQSAYREFSSLRQKCKKLSTESYNHYVSFTESSLLTNPKQFWRFVNSKRKSGDFPNVFYYNDVTGDSGPEIANMFAAHFLQVYSDRSCSGDHNDDFSFCDVNLFQHSISLSDVYSHLCSLDINKGPGPDGLPPALLKHCSFVLARPLHGIFNESLTTGVFPEFWKLGYITPIHKSGSRDQIINYRPITILSIIPKVFEHIITEFLTTQLSPYISTRQFGFQGGKSADLNLLSYVDFVSGALERGTQVHSIYTDFSKAFDRVNHVVLLSRLRRAGVGGVMLDWLACYLTGRTQTVRFNNYLSDSIHVPSGVPQGSHLGPLLFNLFINDLTHRFAHSEVLLFADDLKLYIEVSVFDDCYKLQTDLNQLVSWCKDNGMELNATKCHSIVFSKSRTQLDYPYKIGDAVLERVSEVKDLGLIIDSKLTFIPHIQNIVSKSLQLLGFIKRITLGFNSIAAIKQLYCALIRARLEYSSSVWSPCYGTHVHCIERVQHKFLRYIAFKLNRPELTYPQIESELHIQTLQDRRVAIDLKMLYNILHSNYHCPFLLDKIGLHVPSRVTRSRHTFVVPSHRTNYGCNNFVSRSCRLANERPSLDFFVGRSVFYRQLCGV